jgi:CRP-like cAMP-binding protein
MSLRDYFENTQGVGVLATADADGQVDVAIYARPHFLADDDEQLALIMLDRLSHQNLQSNPHAAYLFIEKEEGRQGKRLYLTRLREESDREKIRQVRRVDLPPECAAMDDETRYLVHFQVDRVRPLFGREEPALQEV